MKTINFLTVLLFTVIITVSSATIKADSAKEAKCCEMTGSGCCSTSGDCCK